MITGLVIGVNCCSKYWISIVIKKKQSKPQIQTPMITSEKQSESVDPNTIFRFRPICVQMIKRL